MAVKTNERPGTRAVLRYCTMSSYKAREVLDLIRGMDYQRATEILDHTDRAAAPVIAKLLRSAAANAEHNEGLDPGELYVATAYADEGATLKRWRPRARGRATRIRKRSCHITVILARMPDEQLIRRRAKIAAEAADRRARRVAGTRRRREETTTAPVEESTSPVVDLDLSTETTELEIAELETSGTDATGAAVAEAEVAAEETTPADEIDSAPAAAVLDVDDESDADATASEGEGD